MKKIFYFIGISTILLLSSCNNDDIPVSEIKKYTPMVQGTIGQLMETNSQTATRAGVVENNVDFRAGENFYWHNGDEVKLLFYKDGNLNSTPTELIYTGTVDDTDPSKARFTTNGGIDPGNYTVYGLYPADGWSVNGGVISVDYNLTQPFIAVNDATSRHLGQYMFMKANAGEVTIGSDELDAINLDFKHLASVIRVRIYNTNPDGLTLPGYNQLKQISLGFDNLSRNFYSIKGELAEGIASDELVPSKENGEIADRVTIRLTENGLNGFDDGVDFFIPILPTGSFNGFTNLTIQPFHLNMNPTSDQDVVLPYPTTLNIPVNALSFRTEGFEAGKSYYFVINAAPFIS